VKPIPGAKPVPLGQLVRAQDRLSFVYLEHCVVHRDANAITVRDTRGTIHLPAATLGAVLLGPGTTVSQQAMVLLAESGATAVWVGERGVRYYAHGRSLARSARLLEAQARLVSNTRARLRVARAMYAMRFPGEDVSRLTMQQLRGREGAASDASTESMPNEPVSHGAVATTTPPTSPAAPRSTRPYPPRTRASTASSTPSSSPSAAPPASDSSTQDTFSRSSSTSPTSTRPRSASPSRSTSPPKPTSLTSVPLPATPSAIT
jgi:hypothetical protein